MPRRSNNNSLIKKQKKLIENRLIQISMVVDDYIYQNKPISSYTAEMYMREVHYYKDKCFEDERSLQVIEKLIRFMKGIITEQGDTGINVDDLNNFPSSTPIYNVLENLSPTTHDSRLSTPKSTKSVPNFRTYGNKNKKIYRNVNTRGSVKNAKKAYISQDSEIFDLSTDSDLGYNKKFSQSTQDLKLSTVNIQSGANVNVKKMYRYVINTSDKSQNTDIVDLFTDSDEVQNHNNAVENQNANKNSVKVALLQRDPLNLSINVDELTPNLILDELTPNLVLDELIPNLVLDELTPKVINDELTSNVVPEECSQSILTGFNQVREPISKLTIEPSLNNTILIPKPQHREVTYTQNVTQEKITKDIIPTQPYIIHVINEKVHQDTTDMNDNTNINIINKENLGTKLVTELATGNPSKNINILESNTRKKRQKTAKINKTNEAKVRKPRPKKQTINNTFSVEKSRNYQNEADKIANCHNNTAILELSRNNGNKVNNSANINNTSTLERPRNQNKPDNKTKNAVNKAKAAIYNNLIVNDLSWVENIRYVREVARDEYESVTLRDNFWDNFSLPDNWNNDDFLY